MTVVSVRPVRAEDLATLGRLDRETWTMTVGPGNRPDGGPLAVSPGSTLLVADRGGMPVGYVQLRPPTGLASNAHVRLICGLAVARSEQGGGVGLALMEAAAAEARRQGASRLRLHVLGPNLPARRLYERCGFHVEGLRVGEFERDGELVDDVLMAREL